MNFCFWGSGHPYYFKPNPTAPKCLNIKRFQICRNGISLSLQFNLKICKIFYCLHPVFPDNTAKISKPFEMKGFRGKLFGYKLAL